jgi:signal transduction histidine kinase
MIPVMSVPAAWVRRNSREMSGESLVAWLRVAVVASMVALVAFGRDSVRVYPKGAAVTVGLVGVYAVVAYVVVRRLARRATGEPPALAWALTVFDSAAVLAMVMSTGAGRSLFIPVMGLEVIAVAVRFNLRRALLVATVLGAALSIVILALPRPDLPTGERVQNAIWWSWMLFAAALLAGFLSRLAEEAWAGRARAEEEQRTEHQRLTQERHLRQRLEMLEDTRSDFLHAVAHDFRTPIASVEALARALSRQLELEPEERAEMLQIIESHARHLAALLVSVREVALSDSMGPDRNLQLADISFAEVARDAVAAAGLPAERVRVRVDPAVAVVRTDADKMQRIVNNLVENAGRHSPAGQPIDVSLSRRGGTVVLEVADRGPGMPPDVAERAFEKFFGFGESRGSSGLGMWIVAQLCAALGGEVSARPRDGGGLVVSMWQPLIEPAGRRPVSAPDGVQRSV